MVRKSLLWGAMGLLVLGLIVVGNSTWGVYTKMSDAEILRTNAQADRDKMKEREAEIQASLEALKTPRGVEDVIRSRYPLVKPGEEEFVLVDQASGTVDRREATRESVWSSFRRFVGW